MFPKKTTNQKTSPVKSRTEIDGTEETVKEGNQNRHLILCNEHFLNTVSSKFYFFKKYLRERVPSQQIIFSSNYLKKKN